MSTPVHAGSAALTNSVIPTAASAADCETAEPLMAGRPESLFSVRVSVSDGVVSDGVAREGQGQGEGDRRGFLEGGGVIAGPLEMSAVGGGGDGSRYVAWIVSYLPLAGI